MAHSPRPVLQLNSFLFLVIHKTHEGVSSVKTHVFIGMVHLNTWYIYNYNPYNSRFLESEERNVNIKYKVSASYTWNSTFSLEAEPVGVHSTVHNAQVNEENMDILSDSGL